MRYVFRNKTEQIEGVVSSDELTTWCKDDITHYKCPKNIEIIKEFPKTMVSKEQRRVLQINDAI